MDNTKGELVGTEDEKSIFREYVDSPENRVAQFYKNNHVQFGFRVSELIIQINQTYDYVLEKRNKLLKLDKLKMSVFDAALLLNEIVDDRYEYHLYAFVTLMLVILTQIILKYSHESSVILTF
jgi:hypothetical protein